MNSLNHPIIGEGLTYDDVLLLPHFSDILPREVSINSHFTKGIGLQVPIVSAAMDTVTESVLAIAIAQEGGIGVLHKNMTIEQQAMEVRKVKRAESGMILDPVTLSEENTIREARAMMAEYKIGGIPIIENDQKLVGIITNRDLRFEKAEERRIGEVMTREGLVTTHPNTSMEEAELKLQAHKIEKLPVVNDQGHLVGLITYRDIKKQRIKPNANKDTYGRLRVAAAVGVTDDILERVSALVDSNVDAIVIDTAHGQQQRGGRGAQKRSK